MSYANIYLKTKINSQQKHVVRIIYNEKRKQKVKKLMKFIKILNAYQINILNNAVMHQENSKIATSVFLDKFEKPSHFYSARFSNFSYVKSTHTLHKIKYRISI